MPARCRRSERPTVYLDQSTLSDAFSAMDALADDSRAAFQPLVTWVHEAAREANLCLSPAHILELSGWAHSDGDAMAAWLDGLDTVWLYPVQRLLQREDERLVREIAGLDPPSRIEPFAPSFLSLFEGTWTPEQLAEALAQPTIATAVRQTRSRPTDGRRSYMPRLHADIQRDRERAGNDRLSDSCRRDVLKDKRRLAIRKKANDAHLRLAAADPDYAAASASRSNLVDGFVHRVVADPAALPVDTVVRTLFRGFEEVTARRQPGSKRVQRDFGGSFDDFTHAAAGAAYCDVFTCDEVTAECLGGARERLGLSPPLFRRRGEPASCFIERLFAAWEAA